MLHEGISAYVHHWVGMHYKYSNESETVSVKNLPTETKLGISVHQWEHSVRLNNSINSRE